MSHKFRVLAYSQGRLIGNKYGSLKLFYLTHFTEKKYEFIAFFMELYS